MIEKCPLCTAPLEEGVKKCPNCGSDLSFLYDEESDESVDNIIEDILKDEETVEDEIDDIEDVVYECPVCNNIIPADAKICPNCSTIFEDEDIEEETDEKEVKEKEVEKVEETEVAVEIPIEPDVDEKEDPIEEEIVEKETVVEAEKSSKKMKEEDYKNQISYMIGILKVDLTYARRYKIEIDGIREVINGTKEKSMKGNFKAAIKQLENGKSLVEKILQDFAMKRLEPFKTIAENDVALKKTYDKALGYINKTQIDDFEEILKKLQKDSEKSTEKLDHLKNKFREIVQTIKKGEEMGVDMEEPNIWITKGKKFLKNGDVDNLELAINKAIGKLDDNLGFVVKEVLKETKEYITTIMDSKKTKPLIVKIRELKIYIKEDDIFTTLAILNEIVELRKKLEEEKSD